MRRTFVVVLGVVGFGLGLCSRASAEVITKPDGTRFDVAAGTKMTAAEHNVVKLDSGAVRARMPEDGKKTVRPRIVTDAATVMVMEGDALVSVDTAVTTR